MDGAEINPGTKSGLPEGFQLLCNLLASDRKKIIHSGLSSVNLEIKDDSGNPLEVEVGRFLGAGACASVYSLRGKSDGMFAKFSKAAFDTYLANELKVLKHLWTDCNSLVPIPRPEHPELKTIEVKAHCQTAERKCLVLKGILGCSAAKVGVVGARLLQDVFARVSDALDFAHRKEICHMDVRPSNIIISPEGTIQLIDWGCAASTDEEICGFRGSLAYAHDYILTVDKHKIWKPKKEFDMASLAFTMAALIKPSHSSEKGD